MTLMQLWQLVVFFKGNYQLSFDEYNFRIDRHEIQDNNGFKKKGFSFDSFCIIQIDYIFREIFLKNGWLNIHSYCHCIFIYKEKRRCLKVFLILGILSCL